MPAAREAAFFDVDGTLVQSTIVHYYVYFRRRRMSALTGRLWLAAYLAKCLGFLVLDKFDRNRLNVLFYRGYGGLPAEEIRRLATDCHRDVIRPRLFREAPACVAEHRRAGRRVVLVTGSLDFVMRPLAEELGVDDVLAPHLLESNGRFTGMLDGPPLANAEKARRLRAYAAEQGLDLAASYAYADSMADLPMLECVGQPNAVNPEHKLEAVARQRGWPVHRWQLSADNGAARA